MKPAALSPWPLLLSRLQLAHSAVVGRGELEAAGLDAEGLLRARIVERMDASRWSPPDCEQMCAPNLDLESQCGDGLVGVACPNDPACWPGWQWVSRTVLETYRCPAERLFAALREVNGLAPLDVMLGPSIVPVGFLKRRERKIPIVWMLEPEASFETLCSGLRHRLSGDGLIVLLSRPAGAIFDVCRPGNIVVLRVPEANDGDLRLWRALDAIDPSYRVARIIRAGGDDPGQYVEIAIKVPERKYTAWPDHIRRQFEPARTVRTGKPSISLHLGERGQ